jgi:hypothetical protein
MRIHTKIALAGLVGTTAIGLTNTSERAEARTHNVTPDSSVILNKDNTIGTIHKDICSDVVQFPLGGK